MKRLLPTIALAVSSLMIQAQQNADNFKYLDINQVKAGIWSRNLMHYDSTTNGSSYEVPKGSGIHAGAASSVWVSGFDAGGQLRMAGQLYPSNGRDFWPGPLNMFNLSTTPSMSASWDKVWKVSSADIANFLNNHIATSDMVTWPGNGDLSEYQDTILAPFVDMNGDGHYSIADGDYPKIKGDQAIFYIVNDKLSGANHTASQGTSLGIEMHVMAYAYGCSQLLNTNKELNYTTFYDYKIINRSLLPLTNVQVSLWNDVDLGYYGDDFIGCDISRNMGYIYNADGVDESISGTNGYGNYLPAQGVVVLEGPQADANDGIDNDLDGLVDELGETIGMTTFDYFTNSFPGVPIQTTTPATPGQFRNYQTGYWRDNTPFTCGGMGYGGSINTQYVYPDNSYPSSIFATCGTGWAEATSGNVPGNRSYVISSGAFSLGAGKAKSITYAFITSFDSTAANNPMASLAKLKTDADSVRTFYYGNSFTPCNPGIQLGVSSVNSDVDISLYPNPASDLLNIRCQLNDKSNVQYEISDVFGYMIQKHTRSMDTFSIDVSGLANGVYFIRISADGKSTVKKFVKQ